MTAKEALRDWVDELTEEEAEALVQRIARGNDMEFPPLTPEQLASAERGAAQTDAGLGIPHDEVMRRFGRV
ncbi:MAG: hypothetical protein WD557_03110 [Dehalococcoidia bacterium]